MNQFGPKPSYFGVDEEQNSEEDQLIQLVSIKQDKANDARNALQFKKSIDLNNSSKPHNSYQKENVKHRCSCDIESMNSDDNP